MSQSREQKEGVSPTRIPQNMTAADQVIRGVKTMDLLLTLLIPGLVVTLLMYGNIIGVKQTAVILVAVFGLNLVFFNYLPDNSSITFWLLSLGAYMRVPKMMQKYEAEIDDNIEVEVVDAEGRDPNTSGLFDFIEVNETTRELTLIDEIDIENGVVKLTDGSYIAGVSVDGMGMLLADDKTKRRAIDRYQKTLNTLQYPINVRATSRQFDISEIINRYEDRLYDKDMKERPIMERIVKARKNFIEQEVKALGTNTKEYSVITRASYQDNSLDNDPFDFTFIDPKSPVGEFLQKKGIGLVNDQSIDDELAEKALDRAEEVANSIADNRELNTEVMSGSELADQIRYYWRREPVNEGDWEPAAPLINGEDSLVGDQVEEDDRTIQR